MARLKVVASKTEADSQVAKARLDAQGYTTTDPVQYATAAWVAGDAGGSDDACKNVWVVEGTK